MENIKLTIEEVLERAAKATAKDRHFKSQKEEFNEAINNKIEGAKLVMLCCSHIESIIREVETISYPSNGKFFANKSNLEAFKSDVIGEVFSYVEVIKYYHSTDPERFFDIVKIAHKKIVRTLKDVIPKNETEANLYNNVREILGGISDIALETIPEPKTSKAGNEESRTMEIIRAHFKSVRERFQREEDYTLYIGILTNFFEYKPYELPHNLIELKRGSKTKVFTVFNPIHKDLSNRDGLKGDIEYFSIIKVLSPYEGLTDEEIYKGITR